MSIDQKSIGTLIDELITTCMKCWFAQEDIMNEGLSADERFDAAIRTQAMNSRRNQLMRAIDKALGQEASSVTSKTYTKSFDGGWK